MKGQVSGRIAGKAQFTKPTELPSHARGHWFDPGSAHYTRRCPASRAGVAVTAGIRFTGIGGDSDFDQITRADAIKLLRGWGTRRPTEAVDR